MDVPANAFLADPQLQAWAVQYANEFGVPASMVINALVRETGTSIASNGGVVLNRDIQTGVPEVRGNIAQLHSNTWPHITDRNGNRVVTDPTNDQQAIRGLAAALFTTGTGGFFDATRGSVQGPYGWDPVAALIGYNGTWRRARDYIERTIAGGNPTGGGLPGETINYVGEVGQGLTNIPVGFQVGAGLINDPVRQQQTLNQLIQQFGTEDFSSPEWTSRGGIGSDANIPIIGPSTGIAPDTSGTLQDWFREQSNTAGYAAPEDAIAFLRNMAPELAGGPQAFPEGNFPWFTPGAIGQDIGAILQHHAFMPNNLVFNPDTKIWDVPNERRFPSNTGIWGAQEVAEWLPSAQPGFQQDYLKHLGYGADPLAGQNLWPTVPGYGGGANVATGGVDLAHWIARQFGGGGGGSQIWPQWDPNISSGSSGNLGGNVWDATPWYQQWDPNISSGPSGNRGGRVWDASPSTPEFGPGFSVNPSTYDIYRSTTGLPSGGFDPQPIPQGLGYEGSHGITTIDPGILQLGQDINRHAQSMINQGYNQAYNFNQQNQVFAQQNQAPNNGWSYAPNLVNFNPQLSFGTANAFQ